VTFSHADHGDFPLDDTKGGPYGRKYERQAVLRPGSICIGRGPVIVLQSESVSLLLPAVRSSIDPVALVLQARAGRNPIREWASEATYYVLVNGLCYLSTVTASVAHVHLGASIGVKCDPLLPAGE